MKKIMVTVAASILVCSIISAQSLKLVNTFGGDSDSTGGSDLFTYDNLKDENGKYKNDYTNTTRVSDRLQLDAGDKNFDTRLRMEIGTTKLNGKESTIRFRGYGRFKPVDQFNLIAGNEFFTKVPVNAGYLIASDDYPKYARILQNGFGAISNWKLADDGSMKISFAGGLKGTDSSLNDKDKRGLDFGFNFDVRDLVSLGGSFQNATGNQLSAAAFVGLKAIENLTLNAGYIYNCTDTDFISKSAKNAISLSAGYDFTDMGLFLGADIVSGISNEYLDNGDTKKYQKNDSDLTPFQTKIRISYKLDESVEVGAKAKVSMMIGDSDSRKTEIYPNIAYKLSNNFGTISTGVRVTMDSSDIATISIPLTWKCTLADIKK